jgi:cysteine-rich repeat protein
LAPQSDGRQVFVSSGVRPKAAGAECLTVEDCAAGEVCTEAGRCQEGRGELISAGAPDTDLDGVADPFDNCPRRTNPDQADIDGDEVGDLCDRSGPDQDLDGWPDLADNCPNDANPGQEDLDRDGFGDVCDQRTCGNGTIEPGEECDDGNLVNSDGCQSVCTATVIGLLSGKGIVVRDKAGAPTKRRIVVVSRDRSIRTPPAGSADDPRTAGGVLKLANPSTKQEVEFILPSGAQFWKPLGSNPEASNGWKYVDRSFQNGPCKVVVVKQRPKPLIRALCLAKAKPIPFGLDDPRQGKLTVTLQLGTQYPFCMVFGGTPVKDFGTGVNSSGLGVYKKKDAPVPESCLLP